MAARSASAGPAGRPVRWPRTPPVFSGTAQLAPRLRDAIRTAPPARARLAPAVGVGGRAAEGGSTGTTHWAPVAKTCWRVGRRTRRTDGGEPETGPPDVDASRRCKWRHGRGSGTRGRDGTDGHGHGDNRVRARGRGFFYLSWPNGFLGRSWMGSGHRATAAGAVGCRLAPRVGINHSELEM